MGDIFRDWIVHKLKQRRWSYRELSRQADISNALVSRVLSGDMPASADFCIKIATALDEQPAKVLIIAGILPDSQGINVPDSSPIAIEILNLIEELSPEQRRDILTTAQLISDMSPEQRRDILEYVRFRYQQAQRG